MKCDNVLRFFEKINEIPRGSGNEKAVSDYIVSFAKQRGLWVNQDEANNVVIKKPASAGYEKSPVIVIQGHMDMVCEKNAGVEHDFEKDGIKMIYDGDFLRADGTTLGADDGIAAAMALELLDNDSIEHPALECIFTTDEEVGMLGASSLDPSLIDGRIMLNIDSEAEGVFTVGCAGGVKIKIRSYIDYTDNMYENYAKIYITGLQGGHSGIEIDKDRGNAIQITARIVREAAHKTALQICSIDGGSKDNAIPRNAEIVVCCDDYKKLEDIIVKAGKELKNELADTDPNVKLGIEPCGPKAVIGREYAEDILNTIIAIPNGVLKMNKELNLPETSNNIGIVSTIGECVEITCAPRSFSKNEKKKICGVIECIAELCRAEISFNGDYPAWEYNPNSNVKEIFKSKYKELYGVEPVIETVHAGLECGIFAQKIPDMDMISFGPDLLDIHTPNERIRLSSLERVWSFLLDVLKEF